MNADAIHFAATWALALAKVKRAADQGTGVELTAEETAAMIKGIRMISSPEPPKAAS